MREAMAITGYIPASRVERVSSARFVEVFPERNVSSVLMRVRSRDIAEIRVGSTQEGLTLVQLILLEGAEVQTVTLTSADAEGMRAFHDPVLNRIRQEATAKKIMV